VEIEIGLYEGHRDALASLFAEADDSASQIASYRDRGEVLVARRDGAILGHIQIVEGPEPGTVELKSLAVDEQWRSQGIGAAMVHAAVEHCRARDALWLIVATAAASTRALKFYQRQGFRISHVIRDFYGPERGYRPLDIDGVPLLDEVILDLAL